MRLCDKPITIVTLDIISYFFVRRTTQSNVKSNIKLASAVFTRVFELLAFLESEISLRHLQRSRRSRMPRAPQAAGRAVGVGLGERNARTAKQPQGPERSRHKFRGNRPRQTTKKFASCREKRGETCKSICATRDHENSAALPDSDVAG